MPKMNCWEFMECQREPGGIKAGELGVCPVCTAKNHDKVNHGINSGRICWCIAGSKCSGKITGSFAKMFKDCHDCSFFSLVKAEEGEEFVKECKP